MDYGSLITAGASSGMIAVLYALYKIFKHSKCTSKCCGRSVEMSIDLESARNIPVNNSNVSPRQNNTERVSCSRQASGDAKVRPTIDTQ